MAKKRLNENVPIELIDRSCGTQLRLILASTVARYTELMADGVQFPPVELIFNGKDTYFCWDGFQRIAAAERNGKTQIRANVEIGNLEKARWMCMHANSTHGVPRSQEVLDTIVERICKHKKWRELPLRTLAQHTGIPKSVLHRKISAILGEKPRKELVPAGQKSKKKRDEKRETEPETPLCDGAGNTVPSDLVNRYLSRAILQEMIKKIDQIKHQIENGIADGNMAYALLNANAFYADYRNIRNRLKAAVPFALCPYCKGQGCDACHNMGFLNRPTWKAAPKDD